MLKLYTKPSSASSRKAKAWLQENHVKFVEHDMYKDHLSYQEIKLIITENDNGINALISKRSKAYARIADRIPDLSLNEAIRLMNEKPQLLKNPILIDGKKVQVGFNSVDIRQFVPHSTRVQEIKTKLTQLTTAKSNAVS